MTSEAQEHRYRYTVSHEGAHSILHPSYFLNSIRVNSDEVIPYMRCRADFSTSTVVEATTSFLWTDERRAEQQANRFASAILMPKCMVKVLLARTPYRGQPDWICKVTELISNTFNVSHEAAFYRLKELGFIEKTVKYY